jgi:glycosyltransferase involved in cell wall biosynthesis
MINKKLTLSIVIPAYNEESYLSACLDSIAAQTVRPDEVIVVDNNSTDTTVEIAKKYPLVSVIKETKQHQSFAQKTGFDTVKTDIIGRIDADSILAPDWVEKVKAAFADDNDLVALTGSTYPYDVQLKDGAINVFNFYINYASRLAGTRMIWGANCALRHSAWQQIRGKVLQRGDIWEDYDLSFCLKPLGKISYFNEIEAATSCRAVHKSIVEQTRYQVRAIRTFRLRRGIWRATALLVVWLTQYFLYPAALSDKYMFKSLQKLRNSRLAMYLAYKIEES